MPQSKVSSTRPKASKQHEKRLRLWQRTSPNRLTHNKLGKRPPPKKTVRRRTMIFACSTTSTNTTNATPSQTATEIARTLKREFEFIKDKPTDKIDNLDIDKWRARRAKRVTTYERVKRIFTYLKACINTALKHYKLIERFELQHYSLKRKKAEIESYGSKESVMSNGRKYVIVPKRSKNYLKESLINLSEMR